MFCGNCGHMIPNGATVCPNCSATVKKKAPVNNVQMPSTPPAPADNGKRKLSKNEIAVIVITCIFTVILGVFAFYLVKYSVEVKKAPEAVSVTNDLVDVNAEDSAVGEMRVASNSAQSLDEMKVVIGGVEYQFPLMLEDLTANGWAHSGSSFVTAPIEAYQTKYVTLNLGADSMDICLYNPTAETLDIDECYIGSISSSWVDVILAKNITTHLSTRADVIAAYGNPSDKSTNTYLYYGNVEADFILDYPLDNTTPVVTFKFDEECDQRGAYDSDVLLYVNIQWFNPDVIALYNERSAD